MVIECEICSFSVFRLHLLWYKGDLSIHRSFLQAAASDAKRSEQPNRREDKRAWGVCAVQPKVTRINVSACSIFHRREEGKEPKSVCRVFRSSISDEMALHGLVLFLNYVCSSPLLLGAGIYRPMPPSPLYTRPTHRIASQEVSLSLSPYPSTAIATVSRFCTEHNAKN